MRPVTVTLDLAAADDDAICLSQSPGAAGNLTIAGALASGGVATLTVPQYLLLTAAADETGKTFTISYTDRYGNSLTYSTTGPNATTKVLPINAKTVTQVAIDAASAGAVKLGITDVGTTKWIPVNHHAMDFALGIACVVTGTVDYTVQYCYDNLFTVGFTEDDATAFDDATLAGKTANGNASYTGGPVTGVRLKMNSGTGSVQMTVVQAGSAGG